MRKIIVFLSLLWLSLLSVSCTQPYAMTEKEKEEIVKEVQTTLYNYHSDIRKSGLTAEFNYLDSSMNFFWVPPGYAHFLSYNSVSTILRLNAPKFQLVDNAFETLHIIPLSKELASYTGKVKSSMTDLADSTEVYLLVETGVLIKRKNDWKLLHGQTNLLKE